MSYLGDFTTSKHFNAEKRPKLMASSWMDILFVIEYVMNVDILWINAFTRFITDIWKALRQEKK